MLQRAFSLIELIIVIVIIGVISAIAIPRMSSSAENAAKNAVSYDQSTLQRAIDLYEVEHEGSPIHFKDPSEKMIVKRLTENSTLMGEIKPAGIYGPYINKIPTNRINGLSSIRVDGDKPGSNTHGWRYDTSTNIIAPDHLANAKGFVAADAKVISD